MWLPIILKLGADLRSLPLDSQQVLANPQQLLTLNNYKDKSGGLDIHKEKKSRTRARLNNKVHFLCEAILLRLGEVAILPNT